MNAYKFSVRLSFKETARVLAEDTIDVTACTYDIALDKLSEAVRNRHKDVDEIKVQSFSFKIK